MRTWALLMLVVWGGVSGAARAQPTSPAQQTGGHDDLASLPPGPWIDLPGLHDPTLDGVTLAMVPARDLELSIDWGVAEGAEPRAEPPAGWRHAGPMRAPAGQLLSVRLDGLPSGAEARARISWSTLQAPDRTGVEQRVFRTLRAPGDDRRVRVAIAADTHAFALYSRLLDKPDDDGFGRWKHMQRVFDHIQEDPTLDFAVLLTDTAMTACGGGCRPTRTPFGETAARSAASAADALARYRATWSAWMLGRLTARLPVVVLLGDHEGELSYTDPDLAAWSRAAREATLPPLPKGWWRGPRGTRAFAFASGSLLLVALDEHSNSAPVVEAAEDWHLGEAQYAWLERVLSAHPRPFTAVMTEHLVGGLSGETSAWKGRGGLRATRDGSLDAEFLGEQQRLHELLVEYGVDLFLTGHDHVMQWGDRDGLTYVVCGRAGGVGAPWAEQSWYRNTMDYDGDRVPEFETDVTGTRQPGYLLLDVTDERLHVGYVVSSGYASVDGTELLGFDLEPNPRDAR